MVRVTSEIGIELWNWRRGGLRIFPELPSCLVPDYQAPVISFGPELKGCSPGRGKGAATGEVEGFGLNVEGRRTPNRDRYEQPRRQEKNQERARNWGRGDRIPAKNAGAAVLPQRAHRSQKHGGARLCCPIPRGGDGSSPYSRAFPDLRLRIPDWLHLRSSFWGGDPTETPGRGIRPTI